MTELPNLKLFGVSLYADVDPEVAAIMAQSIKDTYNRLLKADEEIGQLKHTALIKSFERRWGKRL